MYAKGALVVPPDTRDYVPHAVRAGINAQAISSLAQFTPQRGNQGGQGSCTGWAYKYVREMMHAIHGLPYTALSAAFPYTVERAWEGTLATDNGADPADGAKALRKLGICPDTAMPYSDQSLYTAMPVASALALAFPWRITRTGRCRSVDEMRQCLEGGYPIVLGIGVPQAFEDAAGTGATVELPPAGTSSVGGHAIALYEIDTTAGIARCMSQWGTPDHVLSLAFLADTNWTFTNQVIE